MKKFASTLEIPLMVAAMCVVLACCSTDESVEIPENETDAESDLQFLGSWSTSQVSFYFMNFDGAMEFKDVLVGWSGWPEAAANAKLDSIESGLRPVFNGEIIFNPDHTYDSNLGVLQSSGKWKSGDNTLTLDDGLASKTVLTVESISSDTLEILHYQHISVYLEDVMDQPEYIFIMVGTRITLTK